MRAVRSFFRHRVTAIGIDAVFGGERMSRAAANGLVFGLSVLVPTLVCSAPDAALDVRNSTRELQQLRRDVDRERAREDLRKM